MDEPPDAAPGRGPRGPVPPYLPRDRAFVRTALLGLAAFVLLALDVHFAGQLTRLDFRLELWLTSLRSDGLRRLGGLLAAPADTPVVVALTAAGLSICLLLGRWRNGVTLAVSVAAGSGLVQLLKDAFGRARPDPGLESSLAFPSGHAEKGVVLYVLLFVLVYDAYLRRRRMPHLPPIGTGRVSDLVAAGTGIGVLVGLGRLLEGLHWTTDVVGGWAYGAAWAAGTLWLFARWENARASAGIPGREPAGPGQLGRP